MARQSRQLSTASTRGQTTMFKKIACAALALTLLGTTAAEARGWGGGHYGGGWGHHGGWHGGGGLALGIGLGLLTLGAVSAAHDRDRYYDERDAYDRGRHDQEYSDRDRGDYRDRDGDRYDHRYNEDDGEY